MILTNNHESIVLASQQAAENDRVCLQHTGKHSEFSAAVVAMVNRERINLSAQWAAMMDLARADRADAIAARPSTAYSLSFAAEDCGLVPHAESRECFGCAAIQDTLRTAAAIATYEFGHTSTLKTRVSAWAVASGAAL